MFEKVQQWLARRIRRRHLRKVGINFKKRQYTPEDVVRMLKEAGAKFTDD